MRKIFLLIALLSSVPSWATFSLVQVKDNTSCSGTSCSVTVTSTGASNLLVVGIINSTNANPTITGATAGACNGSWTHCANCAISGFGGIDLAYCLKSNSGITSISITTSNSNGAGTIGVVWEASSTLGTIAVDSGSTTSGTINDSACTGCVGVSLNLSVNSKFIVGLAACGASCTGVTGTGFTNDLANPGGDGIMHGITSTSGALTSPATWAQNSSTGLVGNAIAFQETASAASSMPPVVY